MKRKKEAKCDILDMEDIDVDLFLMILKHVAWTSILIPIVLINQHVLFKKERQLKWKGIAFA